MRFNEKLNLLMKMSNTTNMLLAEALGIDPSLVSRWRTGSREPSVNSRYIQAVGAYFAAQAKQDFQRVALLELTGHTFEEKDAAESVLTGYLTRWLTNDSKISGEAMQTLLDTISQSIPVDARTKPLVELPSEPSGKSMLTQAFYGPTGIQEASIKLLLRTIAIGQGATLLLYSDEPMDWINSFPAFARQWAHLLMQCIQRGAKVKIIHTLARDSNELAVAVEKWLPFYLTGAITSYYYPRKLDGLFKHTMFTLQGCAGLISNFIKGQDRNSVQYLYCSDAAFIENMQKMFTNMLEQCRPLVRTFTNKAVANVHSQRFAFFAMPGNSCASMEVLPTTGLSVALLDRILTRNGMNAEDRMGILAKAKEQSQALKTHLARHEYTVLVALPRISEVLKGNVRAGSAELFLNKPCTFTAEEYLEHLKNVKEMLRTYSGLQLGIVARKFMIPNVYAFAKPGAGMLMLKQSDTMFAFISEQRDLVTALYRHIMLQMERLPKRERHKDYVLKRIDEFIAKIKAGLGHSEK